MANNNKHTGPNVPALRFPEFSGEWESCKLRSIGYAYNGLSGKSGSDFGTGAPFITYKSVFDNSKIDIRRTGLVKITEQERLKHSQNTVRRGDAFFTISSETPEEVGMSSVLLDDIDDCYLNSFCFGYRPTSTSVAPGYLRHYLRSPRIRKKIIILAQGSTRFNISKDEVINLTVALPSLDEQNKIARTLDLIEERIETQSKIIEEQETLLKSLRDKLLNQYSGSSTQCRLGDILCIGNGKDYQHLSEGDIPVYGTGGLMCHVNESLYDGESVCIGRKGTINKPIFLKGRFWTVDTLFYTHSYKGVLPRFCYHLFCTIDWLTYNEASGVPSLSRSTIEKIPVLIPTIEMQGKIVQILDTIEEKVDTDRKTLQDYQNQKAYLLSRMFI